MNSDKLNNKVVIPTSNGLEIIHVNDIIRLQAEQSYTWIFLDDKSKILSTLYLKKMESILTSFSFIRIHRTHTINIHHIKKYLKKNGGEVHLSDGSIIGVSRRKKEAFINLIYNSSTK